MKKRYLYHYCALVHIRPETGSRMNDTPEDKYKDGLADMGIPVVSMNDYDVLKKLICDPIKDCKSCTIVSLSPLGIQEVKSEKA